MKKIKLLTIFSIIFMLLASLCTLTACGHKHDYSGKVVADKYLASEGNCLKKATYYFSCSCGNKGEDTFDCDEFDHELGADDNCNICQNPPTEGLDYQLNEDGQSYYVAGTGIAGDVDIVIAPYYNNLPVTNVGAYAFELGWYESVIIHDGITSIDRFAFVACYSLESIILPNTLKSIGESAFYDCLSLTSIVIPDSVTNIEDNAFIFCHSLTSINIGNGVTNIGKYAFGDTGYYNDQSNWENGVLYLGKYLLETNEISGTYNVKTGTLLIADAAFVYRSALSVVILPKSVMNIGSKAFLGCNNLTAVFYKGTAEEWNEISIGSYNSSLTNATIYYYSENEPELSEDGSAYDGNYWHYDTDGVTPIIWTKQN